MSSGKSVECCHVSQRQCETGDERRQRRWLTGGDDADRGSWTR
jgi:hypothetical protein